jgi:hypothetical protein
MLELKNFLRDSERDPFFTKLDQESKKLRNAAKDFADFLSSSDMKLLAKQDIAESLNKLHSAPIDQIDVAIDELKKSLLMASAQVETTKKVGINEETGSMLEQMEIFLNKNASLMEEVEIFINKALELNK